MSNGIVEALVESLSADMIEHMPDVKMQDFRTKQYQEVFGKDFSTKDITHFERTVDILWAYTKELFEVRPELKYLQERLEIIPVISNNHNSIAYSFAGKNFVIIDTLTMQFIWMMNKAFFYKIQDPVSSMELFAKIYLHFGTLINHMDVGLVYPKPETPPHKNKMEMSMLNFITMVQEKFLLAHEISHLVITQQQLAVHKENYSSFIFSKLNIAPSASIEIELAVDKMALDMVLDDLKRYYPKLVVDAACEYVFLLIRYFLWFRLAINIDKSEDKQFHAWFARNSQLREIFRKMEDSDELNIHIVNMLDHLEQTLEPGAMAALEYLKKARVRFLEFLKHQDK